VAAALVVALVFAAHDVRMWLREAYWLDEAWVALSVRLPLADLPLLTSSTPIGWTFLLRLVPDREYLRLLPFGFFVLAAVAAYAFGRSLGWAARRDGVLVGLAAGAGIVLLTAAQLRHDLKQYTADAAVALVLLTLVALVESRWSRRRLAAVAAVGAAGMLVSHATVVMVVCAFGGLVIVALARRRWRQLLEALVAAMVAGAAVLLVYLTVTGQGRNPALQGYWTAFFPDLGDLGGYLEFRLGEFQPYLGMPWPLLVILAAGGVVVIALTRRPATAVAVLMVPVVMIVLGVAEQYPLLDQRTSYFLLCVLTASAAIGVAGAAVHLARAVAGLVRRGPERGAWPARWATVAAVVVATGLMSWYVDANRPWLRLTDFTTVVPDHPTVHDDSRAAVGYVQARRQPGDVILVNMLGSFGFAVYWADGTPVVERNDSLGVGWSPRYPEAAGIVVAPSRTPEGVAAGFADARRLAAAPGHTGRIWLVRTHVSPDERGMWDAALAGYPVEQHPVGGVASTTVTPPA
jgi:hypothetical protein